jgi:hypothetical protein
VIAIGWQTYLSLLNQRAAADEVKEPEPEHMVERKVAVPMRAIETREEYGRGMQKCAA